MGEETRVTFLLRGNASRAEGEVFNSQTPCDAAQGDPVARSQILSRRGEATVTGVWERNCFVPPPPCVPVL